MQLRRVTGVTLNMSSRFSVIIDDIVGKIATDNLSKAAAIELRDQLIAW